MKACRLEKILYLLKNTKNSINKGENKNMSIQFFDAMILFFNLLFGRLPIIMIMWEENKHNNFFLTFRFIF